MTMEYTLNSTQQKLHKICIH